MDPAGEDALPPAGLAESGLPAACPARVDAALQTEDLEVLTYPANLLYAQNMLTTTMLQMQRVDLQLQRLKEYLHQHELLAASQRK